ncbi:TPA: hypothetical protein ACQMJD_000679, partial [Streptococcus pyogenes]
NQPSSQSAMMLTTSSKITNGSGGRNNMVLEQAELEMVRNQRLVMINPEMVTITKTEYDLLIEIKNKFLES